MEGAGSGEKGKDGSIKTGELRASCRGESVCDREEGKEKGKEEREV